MLVRLAHLLSCGVPLVEGVKFENPCPVIWKLCVGPSNIPLTRSTRPKTLDPRDKPSWTSPSPLSSWRKISASTCFPRPFRPPKAARGTPLSPLRLGIAVVPMSPPICSRRAARPAPAPPPLLRAPPPKRRPPRPPTTTPSCPSPPTSTRPTRTPSAGVPPPPSPPPRRPAQRWRRTSAHEAGPLASAEMATLGLPALARCAPLAASPYPLGPSAPLLRAPGTAGSRTLSWMMKSRSKTSSAQRPNPALCEPASHSPPRQISGPWPPGRPRRNPAPGHARPGRRGRFPPRPPGSACSAHPGKRPRMTSLRHQLPRRRSYTPSPCPASACSSTTAGSQKSPGPVACRTTSKRLSISKPRRHSRPPAGPPPAQTKITTPCTTAARSCSELACRQRHWPTSSSGQSRSASTPLATSPKTPPGSPSSTPAPRSSRNSKPKCTDVASTAANSPCPPPSSPRFGPSRKPTSSSAPRSCSPLSPAPYWATPRSRNRPGPPSAVSSIRLAPSRRHGATLKT